MELKEENKQYDTCDKKFQNNKIKKNIIITVSIILIIIISIPIFLYVNSENSEKYLNNVNTLLENNQYEEAYNLISDEKLLSKSNDETNRLIQKNLVKYKVTTVSKLMELRNEDWNNIERFSTLISNLNLTDKKIEYNYLQELLKIKEDYGQYFNAIRWINSNEYEQYMKYTELTSTDEYSVSMAANLLSHYSFEKYGLTSIYISELNEETQKLSNAYTNIATALKTRNSRLLEEAKSSSIDSLATISDTQINILLKESELEKAFTKLPRI